MFSIKSCILQLALVSVLVGVPKVVSALSVESTTDPSHVAGRPVFDFNDAPYVKVFGTSSSNKYVIYNLKTTDEPKVFNSDNVWALSDETLPHFMLFVEESDVNRNGYRCAIICTNQFGEVVGLNPRYYRALGMIK